MNTPLINSFHLSLPLFVLLGKATIILLAALGITLTMQRASAGARHLVWLVTLATLLLVPALTVWSPLRVAILPAGAATLARSETAVRAARAPESPIRITAANPAVTMRAPSVPVTTTFAPVTVARRSPFEIALALWSIIALAILVSLAWSGLAVRRIVRNASPLEDASWRTPLYEVADRMGLADAPRLLRSDEAKMPFACGLLSPTIVLPADCDDWTLERRRAVLLHELAHVRRHDLVGHTLGRLACAFYWFHPLVWTAARKLRNESERACDDLALSCGTRATDYAEHLLEIVTSVRRDATPSVALAMARRKEFEGRMLAILDPELRHSSPTRRQSAALIASLALLSLTVGALSPVARSAEAAQPTGPALAIRTDAPVVANASSRLLPERIAVRADTAPLRMVRTDTGTDTNVHERIDTAASLLTSDQVNARTQTRTQTQATTAMADAVGAFASATAVTTVDAVMKALGGNVARTIKGLETGKAQDVSHDERATLLAKVLKSDTSASLRRVAAWGLHEYSTQHVAIDALSNALRHDGDARVREMSAWALGDGDRNPSATEALAAALRSDADEKVRATSAWALGEIGDRSAIDALAGALSSTSATVRMRALWAIGSLEPRQAPRAVVDMLRDPEPRVRLLAAWALFQIEDPTSVSALQAAIRTEQDKEVQIAEIRAIGALGDNSVEALKALVESPDPRMRAMAVHALAGNHAAGPWPWPWPQPRPYP